MLAIWSASGMEWIDQNPSYKAFPVGMDLQADTGQPDLGWQAMEPITGLTTLIGALPILSVPRAPAGVLP
jgi:hypothetical protein